jgi:predicted MPP superfamily phosphohydrolase
MIVNVVRLIFRIIIWILDKVPFIKKYLIFVRAKISYQPYDKRRRVLLRQGVTILAGTAFTGAALGALRKDNYEVTSITIPIDRLPEEFEGFNIALISDIHSSVFMSKARMENYARVVNALQADLIAVTGDFVDSQVDEVYPFAEAFASLKAPYGVYGVLGNHDYYTHHVDEVARHVDDCGIKLLVNDRVTLKKDGKHLHVLGIDDIGSSSRALKLIDRTMAGIDRSVPTLLMCHRPYYFDQAASRNIDLMLSGHTHGGQIVFTRTANDIITPARIASQYVAGLYTIGSSHMYVSRGVGTVGVPIRINCPPEVTKIVLVKS